MNSLDVLSLIQLALKQVGYNKNEKNFESIREWQNFDIVFQRDGGKESSAIGSLIKIITFVKARADGLHVLNL